jgi:hypothetical protein
MISFLWADLRLLHPTLNKIAKMPAERDPVADIWHRGFFLPRIKGLRMEKKNRKLIKKQEETDLSVRKNSTDKSGSSKSKQVMGTIIFDPPQSWVRRQKATLAYKEGREAWKKMNREYPATLEDHLSLENLIAKSRGITSALFIEGALVLGIDPDWYSPEQMGNFLSFFDMGFHYRFRIICAPVKVPLTLQDGERLLKSLEECARNISSDFQTEKGD